MAIQSHTIIEGSVSGSRQNVKYVFTATNSDTASISRLLPIGTDFESDAIALYAKAQFILEEREIYAAFANVDAAINPDQVSEHNTQENFDRRVMGYIMLQYNPHNVNACIPFWMALQIRNGANAAQRAANLGVPEAEYDEFASRMNAIIGASSFLDSDIASVWTDIKESWQ